MQFHYTVAPPLSCLYVPAGWVMIESNILGQRIVSVRMGLNYKTKATVDNMRASQRFFEKAHQQKIEQLIELLTPDGK